MFVTQTQPVQRRPLPFFSPLPAPRLPKSPDLQPAATDSLLTSGPRQGAVPASAVKFEAASASLPAGQPLGKVWPHFKLEIGQQAFQTGDLQQAVQFVQSAQGRWGDDEDYAILRTPSGGYQVYELRMPGWLLKDRHDLNFYQTLRLSEITEHLPGGFQLAALTTENGQFRFFEAEALRPAFAPLQDAIPAERLQSLDLKAKQALQRLSQMEQSLGPTRDHRGIFASLYRVITARAYAEMQHFIAQGDLKAADFEGRLLINFANKYFEAYDAYSAGRMAEVPEVWRSAFDSGRQAQVGGYQQLAVTEVVGLSMVAHIIHDLPLTLQEIGFDPKDPHLVAVYDKFNAVLMAEKANILAAVARHYGPTDLEKLESGFLKVAEKLGSQWGREKGEKLEAAGFTAMRTIAKHQVRASEPQIRLLAEALSDAVRAALPGGN